MSESTAPPAVEKPYARYMRAWAALLILTIIMVFVSNPVIIIMGILAKVSIIAAVFMHLKDETFDFVLIIAFSIVFFAALLFGLIAVDGMGM